VLSVVDVYVVLCNSKKITLTSSPNTFCLLLLLPWTGYHKPMVFMHVVLLEEEIYYYYIDKNILCTSSVLNYKSL
jgi:hypothetical protein